MLISQTLNPSVTSAKDTSAVARVPTPLDVFPIWVRLPTHDELCPANAAPVRRWLHVVGSATPTRGHAARCPSRSLTHSPAGKQDTAASASGKPPDLHSAKAGSNPVAPTKQHGVSFRK